MQSAVIIRQLGSRAVAASNERAFVTKVLGPAANKAASDPSMQKKGVHLTPQKDYPQAALLPLPQNIDAAETLTRFSPHRFRDISATAITCHETQPYQHIDITLEQSASDPHVASYDCTGAVSLNSVMQSNVPSPFTGQNFAHLNMPGGQWEQSSKFMSHNLNEHHYTNLRRTVREGWSTYDDTPVKKGLFSSALISRSFHSSVRSIHPIQLTLANYSNCTCLPHVSGMFVRQFHGTEANHCKETPKKEEQAVEGNKTILSRAAMLKRAVKEYGSTVIVFHVGISLISLGSCYLLVSSGLDVMAILKYVGISESLLSGKVAAGASTFVVAYAVHKIFAPVRISITLGSTPFIVRYLRSRGILKPPAPK